MRRSITLLAVLSASAALALAPAARAASAPAPAKLTLTTLGTNSGPIPRPDRSEPANLVRYGDQRILLDAGDGAAEQLAKVGVGIGQIQTIVLSHLHFDHTGGLFGFLSVRFQANHGGPLTIYGPPGTKETVAQLYAAMKPGTVAVQTMRMGGPADAGVKVIEVQDGSAFSVGDIRVTAVENSHYVTLNVPAADRPVSVSYRFEAPGRTIFYTGDTGPSPKVEQLCKGSDLLVSEIMDPVLAIARIKVLRPEGTPAVWKIVEDHFRREHLAPEEVGKLAKACGVSTVVATHNSLERSELAGAKKAIAAEFAGKIVFAEDLQTF